jgi:hypothetical protein
MARKAPLPIPLAEQESEDGRGTLRANLVAGVEMVMAVGLVAEVGMEDAAPQKVAEGGTEVEVATAEARAETEVMAAPVAIAGAAEEGVVMAAGAVMGDMVNHSDRP